MLILLFATRVGLLGDRVIAGFHLFLEFEIFVLANKMRYPLSGAVGLEFAFKLGAQIIGSRLVLVLVLVQTLPVLISGCIALGALLFAGKRWGVGGGHCQEWLTR